MILITRSSSVCTIFILAVYSGSSSISSTSATLFSSVAGAESSAAAASGLKGRASVFQLESCSSHLRGGERETEEESSDSTGSSSPSALDIVITEASGRWMLSCSKCY